MIEPGHPWLSIERQCELVGLSRSSYYYQPASESAVNLQLMALIDAQYMQTPFFGSRRMVVILERDYKYTVNRKRVQRLMRQMGIEAIYPKPKTSQPVKGHKIYPYLLRNLTIDHANQAWCADITYIPMPTGFMYLVAVMDWYSRYVLSWRLSNTMDTSFCLAALDDALQQGKPAIFNTDQGAQFTSHDFTTVLADAGVAISMDGRGRYLDNIFIAPRGYPLWRTVKYEDIYLWRYDSVPELERGLHRYFDFYNTVRPHQALGNATPEACYLTGCERSGKPGQRSAELTSKPAYCLS